MDITCTANADVFTQTCPRMAGVGFWQHVACNVDCLVYAIVSWNTSCMHYRRWVNVHAPSETSHSIRMSRSRTAMRAGLGSLQGCMPACMGRKVCGGSIAAAVIHLE
jgi:hypothetical protein